CIRDRNVTGVQMCALPISSTAALLPAPVIYKNGESITADTEIDGNTNSDNSTDTDKSLTAKTIDSSNERNNDLSSTTETEAVVEPSLLLTYQRFTTDLTEKIKKVIWRAVPAQQETSIDDIDDKAINKNIEGADKSVSTEKDDAKSASKDNNKENGNKENGDTAN